MDNLCILEKRIKFYICILTGLGVVELFIGGVIIYQQLPKGIVTIDTFLGVCTALIGVLATIIVANHFISIFNFNNKITYIEKEVESVKILKKQLVYTQYEVNNTSAYNAFLEKKRLKAIVIELDNMCFLLKNRNYFDENDKDFRKRAEGKIGYIVNDFCSFLEDEQYKSLNPFSVNEAFMEIDRAYKQMLKYDSYSIESKLKGVIDIIEKVRNNIRENKTIIIEERDKEYLSQRRKK